MAPAGAVPLRPPPDRPRPLRRGRPVPHQLAQELPHPTALQRISREPPFSPPRLRGPWPNFAPRTRPAHNPPGSTRSTPRSPAARRTSGRPSAPTTPHRAARRLVRGRTARRGSGPAGAGRVADGATVRRRFAFDGDGEMLWAPAADDGVSPTRVCQCLLQATDAMRACLTRGSEQVHYRSPADPRAALATGRTGRGEGRARGVPAPALHRVRPDERRRAAGMEDWPPGAMPELAGHAHVHRRRAGHRGGLRVIRSWAGCCPSPRRAAWPPAS